MLYREPKLLLGLYRDLQKSPGTKPAQDPVGTQLPKTGNPNLEGPQESQSSCRNSLWGGVPAPEEGFGLPNPRHLSWCQVSSPPNHSFQARAAAGLTGRPHTSEGPTTLTLLPARTRSHTPHTCRSRSVVEAASSDSRGSGGARAAREEGARQRQAPGGFAKGLGPPQAVVSPQD